MNKLARALGAKLALLAGLFGLLICSVWPAICIAAELANDSIYQLADPFTDQNSKVFELKNGRGRVQIVSMFYSTCPYACPLIIDSVLGLEQALSTTQRHQLSVLMVSFDTKRDTPKSLAALAAKRKLDLRRWTLARAQALTVRKFAALLGLRYRQLENGEFNHSSQLILLDREGRILARTEQMTPIPDAEFLQQVQIALESTDARDANAY